MTDHSEEIELYRIEESWGRLACFGWWNSAVDISLSEWMFGGAFIEQANNGIANLHEPRERLVQRQLWCAD